MTTTRLVSGFVAAGLLFAACGDDPAPIAAPSETAATAETDAAVEPDAGSSSSAAIVADGDSAFGPILVDAEGLSLYGFTEDTDGVPTCNDACADAWPPVIVEDDAALERLDPDVFSVAERADGSLQLVAGVWPLYRFAGDAVPGDANGQLSGDVWFLATPDGSLIRGEGDAAAAASSGY